VNFLERRYGEGRGTPLLRRWVNRGPGTAPSPVTASRHIPNSSSHSRTPHKATRSIRRRDHPSQLLTPFPRRGFRTCAATQGGSRRDAGDRKPFRLRCCPQAQVDPARHAASHSQPQGRVPGSQSKRDLAGVLRSLRAPYGPQDGKRLPSEEPIPLCFVRRFPPYHEFSERRDARQGR
jgi:hypothetical protein